MQLFNEIEVRKINIYSYLQEIGIDNKIKFESVKISEKSKKIVLDILISGYISLEKLDNLISYIKDKFKDFKVLIENVKSTNINIENKQILSNVEYLINRKYKNHVKSFDKNKMVINDQAVEIHIVSNILKEKMEKDEFNSYIKKILKKFYNTEKNIRFIVDKDEEKINDKIENYITTVKTNSKPSKIKTSNLNSPIIKGKNIKKVPVKINEIREIEGETYCTEGKIISSKSKKLKDKLYLITLKITDFKSSINIKVFLRKEDDLEKYKNIENLSARISGKLSFDKYSKEYVLMADSINLIEQKEREDLYPEKRIELHAHTKMSSMDGMNNFFEIANQAYKWGHKAIALTDHGVIQGFPEAMEVANKIPIKVIYGLEGYLVNDELDLIKNPTNNKLDEEIIVFDFETTGLNSKKDKIIEIGAVKIKNNAIIDKFNQLIDPEIKVPEKIQSLTGITTEMLQDKPLIDKGMKDFFQFIGSCSTLCAHNADFDFGFLENNYNLKKNYTIIDTLELSRRILKNKRRHNLKALTKHFKIELENHHRAVDDSEATAKVLIEFFEILKNKNIENLNGINDYFADKSNIKNAKTFHVIILVKDYIGLKNLYKLVSLSHLKYFYKKPRIPKSILNKYREGLIIGTACEAGELYQGVLRHKKDKEIEEIAKFYDFLEVQPLSNNAFLIANGAVEDLEELAEINKKIIQIGDKLDKMVCATGDVHFLNPYDEVYRRILMYGQGFRDADNQAPLYLKTTDEIIKDFNYLSKEKAEEIIIKNPNKISDMIENIKPIPDGTFPPIIEGSEETLKKLTYKNAERIYGENLPEIVEKRISKELNSIISNGYAVMYIIAHKLVKKSLEDGYLVGSRGSVGSSFVATLSDITDVNPLPPHYICPKCKYFELIDGENIGSGVDLDDKICPKCSTKLNKEGHNIPFEVFLGFKGDKEPDIDLNFAGEEQMVAMKYAETLFGEGYVYRAGTIGTIASKTAYGFVKNYFDEKEKKVNKAEIDRLVDGCTGVRKTTGQHPGGIMIVPKNKEIYDFTPIQYPANNSSSGVITTHFDYHSISGRILKLDILGHDTPSIIRMLEDLTGFSSNNINLDDSETLSLFKSPEILGLSKEDINCEVGTLAIPEFGTDFVRQMLIDTRPKTFSDLVRISGLSHGTDVWLNNAQELIRKNITTIDNVISTRDDIMTYLIYKGLEKKLSFNIMEKVRKGKGVTSEEINKMKEKKVPNWYIESCKKIKYMFPKAHAVAYVTMSFKIAYYKINYPQAFYCTYFTTKAADFDSKLILKGESSILREMKEISDKGKDKTQKDKNLYTVLEVALEMYKRKLKFKNVDLYKSDDKIFKICGDYILPPLISIEGMGQSAAKSIVEERTKGEFISIEDLTKRCKITKTSIEGLKEQGCLAQMDETNQISLFG